MESIKFVRMELDRLESKRMWLTFTLHAERMKFKRMELEFMDFEPKELERIKLKRMKLTKDIERMELESMELKRIQSKLMERLERMEVMELARIERISKGTNRSNRNPNMISIKHSLICGLLLTSSVLSSVFPVFESKHLLDNLTEESAIATALDRYNLTNATFFCKDDLILKDLFVVKDISELYFVSGKELNSIKVIMDRGRLPRVRRSSGFLVFNSQHYYSYPPEDVIKLVSGLDSETKDSLPIVKTKREFERILNEHKIKKW